MRQQIKMLAVMAFLFLTNHLFAGKEPELRSFKLCSALSPGDTLLVYDQLFLNSTGGSTGVSPSGYHLFTQDIFQLSFK